MRHKSQKQARLHDLDVVPTVGPVGGVVCIDAKKGNDSDPIPMVASCVATD